MVETKEKGNIFFFYRPKVEADSAKDVQRFYIVLHNDETYRLMIVGRKELPEDEGRDASLSRNWVLMREVTQESNTIEEILEAAEYETKTKGTQQLPPAAPLAEGRYAIVEYNDQTELVYKLKREKGEEVKELFGLKQEASFTIAVKNPDSKVEGFPEASPDYTDELKKLFKNRRWLPIKDTKLLDYKDVQLILISARDKKAAQQLGITLKKQDEASILSAIDLDLPDKALLKDKFPKLKEFDEKNHPLKEVGFSEGGKKGGKEAAKISLSASGLASLLSGIELPAKRDDILQYAKKHKDRVKKPSLALQLLQRIKDEEYKNMADIQQAFSEASGNGPFECPVCGAKFDTNSELQQHLQTSHPEQAVSAADIQEALSGISFPKSKKGLLEHIEKNEADEKTRKAIEELPDKKYHDSAEVSVAFQESITGEESDLEELPSEKAMKSDSAAAVTQALKGISLPVNKEQIVDYAKNRNTRKEIMAVLQDFPEKKYEDMSDIVKTMGKVKK